MKFLRTSYEISKLKTLTKLFQTSYLKILLLLNLSLSQRRL